ncbi:DUF927 domain-containing protein [Pseudomonas syringae]|nr:DUF927 domain-containing protein [Pseudomonas syringae]
MAVAHSDSLLVLNEISMCDPRLIGEAVYMFGNGNGNGNGEARANDLSRQVGKYIEWRLLFLSIGEKVLAQHMAEANRELKAGRRYSVA